MRTKTTRRATRPTMNDDSARTANQSLASCDLDLWPLDLHALAQRTTCATLHQNWQIRFQSIVLTSLATDRHTNRWMNNCLVIVVDGMQLWDCVAPYININLHRKWFWAKSAASGSIRWCCFRSCWMVLSHVMRGRPGCLLQSAGGEANRILLASALSSMRIICPNGVSRCDWIIAVSLGCFVSLHT